MWARRHRPATMTLHISTGVEMELWVVDERGALCDGHHLAEAHERVDPEFVDPLLEVRTEPHDSERDLRRDLRETLEAVLDAAGEDGKHLVPLGTPLTACEAPADSARGRLFEEIYGDGVVSAKNCAGTHVHFEQDDVLDQLNLLTALDPALALVSSSPYYLGGRGADSSRAAAYRRNCGADFHRFCELWPYADSLDEWDGRVADAYDAFLDLAEGRGVDRARVETHFDPEDTVLNPVRLRQRQPTVEWRAPDTALPSQVLRLAGDVGELLTAPVTGAPTVGSVGVDDGSVGLPSFSTLREVSEAAIRDGLASDRVRTYLEGMGLDPGAYRPIAQQLYGPSVLEESTARDLRLEYARRLQADVRSLEPDPLAGGSPHGVQT